MMVGAMLGVFLVKNKFSNRSQLSEQFTRGKLLLFCSYFLAGFPHKDILQFLRTYITELAMCHLHRIFRKQKLFQKNKSVSSIETLNSVAKELKESRSSYGYRFIHQKIRMEVSQQIVN